MKNLKLNKQTIAQLNNLDKIFGGEMHTKTGCGTCYAVGVKINGPSDHCDTYGGNSCDPANYYCQSNNSCNPNCQTDEFTCNNTVTQGPCI